MKAKNHAGAVSYENINSSITRIEADLEKLSHSLESRLQQK